MKKSLKLLALSMSLCMVMGLTAYAGEPAPGGSAPADAAMPAEGGESQGGESQGGESGGDETVMSMSEGAAQGPILYTISEDGLTVNEDAEGYELTGEVTETGADGITLNISDFTANGFKVTGGEYTISNSTIVSDVTGEVDADAAGGYCAGVTGGKLTLINCDFTTNGKGGRNGNYTVDCEQNGTLVVINSKIIQTGLTGDPNGYTADIADPPSNAALVISGYARANMSVGTSKTYYYGSYVEAEGWAAMSTDSAQSGFAFYSYDSIGKTLHGGYGTYADTSCVDWFYATVLSSPEVGAIISNNGEIHMAAGEDASAEALEFLPEDYEVTSTYTENNGRSKVEAGRNDFQLHSPDMMGSGAGSDYKAILDLKSTDISTTAELDAEATLVNWSEDYGPALGEYVDFVKGANILVKSTGATITLNDVTAESTSNVLLLTALNSDSMSRYALATDDMTDKGVELTISNSEIKGDVDHYDYQRNTVVFLENATWEGAYVTIDKEAWDALWSDECKADESCYWILDTEKYYDGADSLSTLNIDAASTWYVTGDSTLDSLTVEAGGKVLGTVYVDGEAVDVTAGGTWTGSIEVFPQ